MVCKSVGFLRRNPLILAFFIVGMGSMFYAQAADEATPPTDAAQLAPQAAAEDAAQPAPQAAAEDAAQPAAPQATAEDAAQPAAPQATAEDAAQPAAPQAAAEDAAQPAAAPADAEAQPEMAAEKPCGSIAEESVNKLQDGSTPAGEKLSLMQSLADFSKEEAQKCLQVVTEEEMIALTVIELARHTDKALAEKAKAVEANFDITSYVDTAFTDPVGQIPNDIITLLLRLEKERVEAVLSSLSPEKKQAIEEKLSHYVPTILIPTGSKEGGDLYYVKISWDKENSEQVDCLAKVLHEELDSKQSVEEQKRLMEERGQRVVHSVNKGWAIHIFERAYRCKATPAFVRN